MGTGTGCNYQPPTGMEIVVIITLILSNSINTREGATCFLVHDCVVANQEPITSNSVAMTYLLKSRSDEPTQLIPASSEEQQRKVRQQLRHSTTGFKVKLPAKSS
jgi:hypothetical protein